MYTEKIDEIFKLWQGKKTPGGQVLVRKDGKIIYDKCFGYALLEHDIPITDDTVFHVASVSKQVTILSLLILWDEGKLDLDADLTFYIPEYIGTDVPITVRQAMNNCSGIRDQWELLLMGGTRIDDVILQEDLLNVISRQKELNFKPQSQYLYSNSNFTLCAEIVRKISSKTLDVFAKERIFDVLGMDSTCIKMGYTDIVPHRALSYLDNGSGSFINKPLNYGVLGAISLNTNAHDFIKLIDEYKNPKHFPKRIFDLMFTPAVLSDGETSVYGGGMMIQTYKNLCVRTHGGVDAAYRADIAMYENDLDVIIFSNTQNTIPSVASKKIADIVLNLEDNLPFEVSEKAENDIFGVYSSVNEPYMLFDIANSGKSAFCNKSPLCLMSNDCYHIGYTEDIIDLGAKPHFKIGAAADSLRKLSYALSKKEHLGRYYSSELDCFYYINEKCGKMYLEHYKNGSTPLFAFSENIYTTFSYRIEMTDDGFKLSGNRAKGIDFKRA